MKNKLNKWPNNWIEHVNETCSFYFEKEDISFIHSATLYEGFPDQGKISSIRLEFTKYKKQYDIFIERQQASFIMSCYYKDYYRIRKRREFEQDFISFIGSWLQGSDSIGLFKYLELGGEIARENKTSAYQIACSIKDFIDCHNENNDDDDEGGENDPIEPFSPSDVMEPELLNC